jgi:hypothetical protein
VSTMLATFALEESRCLGQPITVPNNVPVAVPGEMNDLRRDDRSPDANGLDRAS